MLLSIHTSINYTYIAISNSISENWILGDELLAHCRILLRGWPFCVPKDAESDHVDDFNPHLFGDGLKPRHLNFTVIFVILLFG